MRRRKISGAEPLRGRDAVWAAIRDVHRRFNDGFTVLEVGYRARVPVATARDYMRRLERAGYLAKAPGAAGGSSGGARYVLVRDAGVEAPRIRRGGRVDERLTGQERLWAAMKALRRGFTSAELCAATGIRRNTVASYVRRLAGAGYLDAVEPGRPWHAARWRLMPARNTGPRAPALVARQLALDLNTGIGHDFRPSTAEGESRAGRRSEETANAMTKRSEEMRAPPGPPAAAADPTNVVDLGSYRRPRADQAPPPASDPETATREYRRWIGRALRACDFAKEADRPSAWRRAARIVARIYHHHVHEEFIGDLAAELALLAIDEESA